MTQLPIARPRVSTNDPADAYTRTAPDYTGEQADNRVLLIDLRFLKLGIPEISKAIALVLCLIILAFSFTIMIVGLWVNNTIWLDRIFSWLGNAFLFLVGFAVGDVKAIKGQTKSSFPD